MYSALALACFCAAGQPTKVMMTAWLNMKSCGSGKSATCATMSTLLRLSQRVCLRECGRGARSGVLRWALTAVVYTTVFPQPFESCASCCTESAAKRLSVTHVLSHFHIAAKQAHVH
eukprot:6191149-Amphidinium_carterae.2